MTEVLALEPITFPLKGQQLIEASAGTGKTYTITALYLRLLLGLGDIDDQPLGPDQILVVTFTEAATEELRERIRQRIIDARSAFLQSKLSQSIPSGDPILDALQAKLTDTDQAVRLLEQAARQMDEAAIFTIHGFCQRMLKQHAFESGSLFETELTQDDQSLLRHAVLDFWRNEVYPLDRALTQCILEIWANPDRLMLDIRSYIHRAGIRIEPDLSAHSLRQLFDQRQQALNQFKQAWLENDDDLQALIQDSSVNKRSYTKASLPKWLSRIDDYAASELMEPNKELSKILQRFSQQTLREKSAAEGAPEHPLFQQLQQLLDETLPVKELLTARALKQISQRFAASKRSKQLQTFDDLLSGLHAALSRDATGALAQAIRQQFPVAMIDEFQDTDPTQYEIFTRLYADIHRSALIMIGDPKQAIYAFRGADIFTYIRARRGVDQTYTLDKNWRSTPSMVAAVNQLFQQAAAPFIYDEDIPFTPVSAAKQNQAALIIEGEKSAALTLWHQDVEVPMSKQQHLALFAKACAAEIDRLLSGHSQIGEGEKARSVSGSDIAVLVRDRSEAEAVQRALAEYEHPCVYLSNRDSVFNSAQAQELALLLAAIENPLNERALRAALATELMRQSAYDLDCLNHDELRWQALVEEFSDYRTIWKRSGVLPMLHRLLHQRNLAAQILADGGGERVLTNLLHMAELLQQAGVEIEGMSGLLRWLNEQIVNAAGEQDDRIMRLESENNVVTIVTVHKSKGLEYPIVFLPFASLSKESKTAFYHDPSGVAVLDLAGSEEALQAADQERLAEDLRLLYVALTRSIYACYIGISPVKRGNSKTCRLKDSALGYLLHKPEQALAEVLEQLATEQPAISIQTPPEHGGQRDMFAWDEPPATAQALVFNAVIDRQWRVSSYSALTRHSGASLPEFAGIDLEVSQERDHTAAPILEQSGKTIFSFPKGANAGTFLHSVFEEISFTEFNAAASDGISSQAQYEEQIAEQLLVAGYDADWLPAILQLVEQVLNANLDQQGLKLADITDQDRVVEMEFMLRAEHLKVAELESLIRRYDPLSAQAVPVAFEPLKGMLKGFIDLLFRQNGRYYVLDYKSNYLGGEAGNYSRDAMAQAMIEHRYDLQYILYSLAVHRLLKLRIADYDYDRHFGGVFYLFLRGINADNDEGESYGIFNYRPEKALIEQLDQLFSASEENTADSVEALL